MELRWNKVEPICGHTFRFVAIRVEIQSCAAALARLAATPFNKSHSAAYGIVTYRTAFLKANYPVEFMVGVLSLEISNTDKIENFVSECQRMGIEILPPDINKSDLKFSPESKPGASEPHAIRFGLAAIKNVGEGAMQMAIEERERDGPFKTLEDFASRLDSKAVNKKNLEALIKVGAFDFTGETRLTMFERLDQVIASASAAQKDRKSGQASLFGDFEMAPPKKAAEKPPAGAKKKGAEVEVHEWPKMELIGFEKELLGFYVSGHPLDNYKGNFESTKLTKISAIEEITQRTIITVGALIEKAEMRYSKKDNRPFSILKIADFTGSIEAMCWGDEYEKFKEFLVVGSVVEVRASCSKDDRTEMNKLMVRDVKPMKPRKASAARVSAPSSGFSELPDEVPQVLVLKLDTKRHGVGDLQTIRSILVQHPGNVPVQFVIDRNGHGSVRLAASQEFSVSQTTELVQDLLQWL